MDTNSYYIKKLISFFWLSILIAGMSMPLGLEALTFNHTTSAGTTYDTSAISTFETAADDMVGMEVTAYFNGGGSETAIYGATGANTGAATGTNWLLSVDGASTFHAYWTLESISENIHTLVINAAPGDTVFDYIGGEGLELTPDSNVGGHTTFPGLPAGNGATGPGEVSATNNSLDLTFTYSNEVGLNGTVYGDLFTTLTITFNNASLASNETLTFVADTDNVLTPGDLNPATPVPEPETYLLLGSTLLLTLFIAKKKRKIVRVNTNG